VRRYSLALTVLACHAAPTGRPPIAAACGPNRVGRVTIEHATAAEVAPLAVLEGTLDDPARTARIAEVAAKRLRARGWPDARVEVRRREGCGVELDVAVIRGVRGTPPALAPDEPAPVEVAYDDAELGRYVQTIADRLARVARVDRAPRVVIGDHEATYAASPDLIVIGRAAIAKLGSEAELAGIVAHELAHIEGDTISLDFVPEADGAWLAARRDAEGVADERAVALLERAGYAPAAMGRALRAVLDEDDDEHPPSAERIARVDALAAGRRDGFVGRLELLAHVDRVVVGRDTRLGTRVGRAWVVAQLGIALELRRGDRAQVDGDALVVRHGPSALTAYTVAAPNASELAATLADRAELQATLGHVTVGIAPRARRRLVIVERARGGLVLELAAKTDPFDRDRWISGLRSATAGELAAAEPARVALARAPHAGRVRELAEGCPDPDAALALDDADRELAAGDLMKCTDR
jgi:hypothetical protein